MAEPAAPSAPSGKRVRPRVSPWKAGAFVLAFVALTPFWLLYGLIGSVLTASSKKLSAVGLVLLSLLSGVVLYEVYLIEHQHGATFVEFVDGTDDAERLMHELEGARNFLQMLALLGTVLAALLVGQWRFHNLVMVCLDQTITATNGLPLLVEMLAPLFFAVMLWESVCALKHWQFVTGITLVAFALLFLLLPVVVAISHAKFWIPARYEELERVERHILSRNLRIPFEMMKIAGLGTVFVPCTDSNKTKKQTIVLVHGFAAGNALWACNLEHLAQFYNVYAIEWVGTGRSDRPNFASYEQEEADTIFVNAIEEWRKELKLDTFVLCGHSMGAMFASSYAVRFPDRVDHLVLVSPAGVGHPPPPGQQPLGIKIFRFLWNLRLTPMSVARYAGPFGPALLRFIASARISVMPETSAIKRGLIPKEVVAEYWYHNWALKKSGEIAMHTHLLPGVFARKPLCEMLTPATIKVPITFMYGGGPDWMDSSHGEKVAESFVNHQRVQVLKVPLAGHQVFMDNVDAFNTMLIDALRGDATN
uniref:AB hydrolase-1 domain-containing protein n=1 Tax=Globisporangium ultimum (strain ATCC 200006 / CBS 805.95 / DAOM BR144) TaxID=431595 RepID=K3WBF1_GLOUD